VSRMRLNAWCVVVGNSLKAVEYCAGKGCPTCVVCVRIALDRTVWSAVCLAV
jgi:hypothetical protein